MPTKATDFIRKIAKSDDFDIHYTKHAKERMYERDIILDDVLHVLNFGYIYKEGKKTTQKNHLSYEIECKSPTGREIKVVFITDLKKAEIKIKTVMWKDEK